jgi:hypothetical protein
MRYQSETRRHPVAYLLGIVVVIVALGARADQKQDPSDLSISDRLAQRTAARQSMSHANAMSANVQQRTALVIDGSQTPELFMPSELMAMLLDTYSLPSASRSAARQQYHAAIVSFHWNEGAFWKDIDAAAAGYFQAALANQGKARSTNASKAICGQRATILEQMRKRYANFDRFLYGDFAARQTLSTSEDQSESWLVWMNGGCR